MAIILYASRGTASHPTTRASSTPHGDGYVPPSVLDAIAPRASSGVLGDGYPSAHPRKVVAPVVGTTTRPLKLHRLWGRPPSARPG